MTQAQVDVTVAIVFADISGSTALYEKVGNAQARTHIAACLDLMRDIIAEHGGDFIHSRGDDVLCTFASPQNAFATARAMLAKTAQGDLSVHIGIDYGTALRTPDDIFGDPVNVAARLADLANPKEALCTHALFSTLSDGEKSLVRFFDTRQLRGKAEADRIYRMADFNLTMTTQISHIKTDHSGIGAGRPTAYLSFLNQTVACNIGVSVSIGRDEKCDLTIPRQWVSRQHAVVEMHKNQAYLRDVSSNGTYVCLIGQPPILLRRESMALPAICTLSPTRSPDANDAVAITCHVTSQTPAKSS